MVVVLVEAVVVVVVVVVAYGESLRHDFSWPINCDPWENCSIDLGLKICAGFFFFFFLRLPNFLALIDFLVARANGEDRWFNGWSDYSIRLISSPLSLSVCL